MSYVLKLPGTHFQNVVFAHNAKTILNTQTMPVRDRRYEYRLQFILGGLLTLVAVGEVLRRVALWCTAHWHLTSKH